MTAPLLVAVVRALPTVTVPVVETVPEAPRYGPLESAIVREERHRDVVAGGAVNEGETVASAGGRETNAAVVGDNNAEAGRDGGVGEESSHAEILGSHVSLWVRV